MKENFKLSDNAVLLPAIFIWSVTACFMSVYFASLLASHFWLVFTVSYVLCMVVGIVIIILKGKQITERHLLYLSIGCLVALLFAYVVPSVRDIIRAITIMG
jgi:lipoprotein